MLFSHHIISWTHTPRLAKCQSGLAYYLKKTDIIVAMWCSYSSLWLLLIHVTSCSTRKCTNTVTTHNHTTIFPHYTVAHINQHTHQWYPVNSTAICRAGLLLLLFFCWSTARVYRNGRPPVHLLGNGGRATSNTTLIHPTHLVHFISGKGQARKHTPHESYSYTP